MEVARADFGPRVGDADEGLAHIGVAVAYGFEHAARRGAAGSIGDGGGMLFEIGHDLLLIDDCRLPTLD
jgi:hypothetical protein